MKKGNQNLDDKLLDYIDGKLTSSERESLEIILGQQPDLQSRLEELRQANLWMKQITLDTPSVDFTKNVLAGLNKKMATGGLPIRHGLFLLAGVLLIVILATALISAGIFDNATTTLNLNIYKLPTNLIDSPLPSIALDGKLLVNGIVILNLILGFIVLDRAILKPFFRKRVTGSHQV